MAKISAKKENNVTPEPAVDTEGEKTFVFYFQRSNNEMRHLAGLLSSEKILLSSLAHTFRLGVHLDQKIKDTAVEIDLMAGGAVACKQYIESTLVSDLSADRYFPRRLSGPSMKAILHALLLQSASATSAKIFLQLCIWRTFAFGDKNRIGQLDLGQHTSPDVTSIATTIIGWGGNATIALPMYGNFQVIKAKAPIMLQLLCEFPQTLPIDLTTRPSPFTFTEIYDRHCKKDIPSIPRGGIIVWLLISDFFEYGLCLQPTEADLTWHIIPLKGSRGSPSDPVVPLRYIARQSNAQVPKDPGTLVKVFRNV